MARGHKRAANDQPDAKTPKLDRFETLRRFVGTWNEPSTLAELVKAGKMPAAIVWLVLFDKTNRRGVVEWMTITRLSEITGMDRITVRKALDYLVKNGDVEMIGERGQNVKGVPTYRVPHANRDADE